MAKPKIELAVGESASLTLLRDPYEGQNDFGRYWLYNVRHENVEKVFFGASDVQEAVTEAGVAKGDTFEITRMTNGRKGASKWTVEKQERSSGSSDALGEDEFKRLMRISMLDAIELTQSIKELQFHNDDVRAISNSLFIARTR